MKVPIFIIVHDRITVLKQCVDSIEKQITTPIEIIFHNVASTFPECLDYLKEMEKKGYSVYHSKVNNHRTVISTINSYLKQNPKCLYYVLIDSDIALDNFNGDILEYYIWLMHKY